MEERRPESCEAREWGGVVGPTDAGGAEVQGLGCRGEASEKHEEVARKVFERQQ